MGRLVLDLESVRVLQHMDWGEVAGVELFLQENIGASNFGRLFMELWDKCVLNYEYWKAWCEFKGTSP